MQAEPIRASTVDSTGAISATFSNGQVQQIGQVAIAAVPNEDGLTRVGDNNFQTSAASGVATFAAAGVGSRGTIEDETVGGVERGYLDRVLRSYRGAEGLPG